MFSSFPDPFRLYCNFKRNRADWDATCFKYLLVAKRPLACIVGYTKFEHFAIAGG
jgi:hypothetical protein